MLSVFIIFINFFYIIYCCELGLTQLRHRTSLALMKCVPTLQGQPDPCVVQTGGRMAFCQHYNGDFVCCGTTQLLIELIAPASTQQGRQVTSSLFDNTPRERAYQDYNVVIRSPGSRMTSDYQMSTSSASQLTPLPPVVFQKTKNIHKPIKKPKPNFTRSPVSLHLLSTPSIRSAGPNSWEAIPAVILLQDGNCNVLVNTGLPTQGPQVVEALTSRGVHEAKFTVATSSHLQFVGNLNLFPKSQIIVGRWHARETMVTRWNTGNGYRMDLCSQSVYTIPTPGPSDDAITVMATNVPAMGTIAIVGSLFTENEPMERLSSLWVSTPSATLQSRRVVICAADWILPAFSMPFPVTPQMRVDAGCNNKQMN